MRAMRGICRGRWCCLIIVMLTSNHDHALTLSSEIITSATAMKADVFALGATALELVRVFLLSSS